MDKQQAIDYLTRVLTTWSEFCKYHSKFAKAIEVVLNELK